MGDELSKAAKRSKAAISKAQQVAGVIPPNLADRVTALEMSDIAIDGRIDNLETYNTQGFSGTVTIVESVNFTAQTVVSKMLTYVNGKLTGVA